MADLEHFFVLALGLIFSSVFVAINVTLALFERSMLDNSLSVVLGTNASGGRSDAARVTFLFSLAPRFLRAAVWQKILRHTCSAGGSWFRQECRLKAFTERCIVGIGLFFCGDCPR